MGRFKGFQIACDISGPLRDLTGRGCQRSGKVDHKKAPPLGDLAGTGDQPRGKL